MRHYASGRFDWLISGHQSVDPSREAISILSGKQKIYVCPIYSIVTQLNLNCSASSKDDRMLAK